MRNPYMQVALTYPRRLLGSWFLILVLLGSSGAILSFFMDAHNGLPPGIGLMWLWWPYMLLVGHVKEQFAHARARLTPEFVRPHLVVGAGAGTLVAVALPVAIALVRGVPIAGMVSLFVGIFGFTAWSMVSGSSWLSWPMLVLVFGTCFPPGSQWVQDLIEGQHPRPGALFLIAGMTAAVAAAVRLVKLNEEMPSYHHVAQLHAGWTKGRPVISVKPGQSAPWLLRFIYYLQDAQMERLIKASARVPKSSWARLRRWQVGSPGGPALALIALSTCAFFAFIALVHWMSWHSRSQPILEGALIGGMIFSLVLALIAASIISVSALTGRRPALARELLFPVERGAFFRQSALAAVLTHVQVCLALVLPILAVAFLYEEHEFHLAMWAWRLAVFALLQVFFLSVTLWMLRLRSQYVQLLLAAGITLAATLPLGFPVLGQEWNWTRWVAPSLAVAGGLALLGLLILYDAYRRWLRVELG